MAAAAMYSNVITHVYNRPLPRRLYDRPGCPLYVSTLLLYVAAAAARPVGRSRGITAAWCVLIDPKPEPRLYFIHTNWPWRAWHRTLSRRLNTVTQSVARVGKRQKKKKPSGGGPPLIMPMTRNVLSLCLGLAFWPQWYRNLNGIDWTYNSVSINEMVRLWKCKDGISDSIFSDRKSTEITLSLM